MPHMRLTGAHPSQQGTSLRDLDKTNPKLADLARVAAGLKPRHTKQPKAAATRVSATTPVREQATEPTSRSTHRAPRHAKTSRTRKADAEQTNETAPASRKPRGITVTGMFQAP